MNQIECLQGTVDITDVPSRCTADNYESFPSLVPRGRNQLTLLSAPMIRFAGRSVKLCSSVALPPSLPPALPNRANASLRVTSASLFARTCSPTGGIPNFCDSTKKVTARPLSLLSQGPVIGKTISPPWNLALMTFSPFPSYPANCSASSEYLLLNAVASNVLNPARSPSRVNEVSAPSA
jgi:hypothetical protein